MDTEYRIWLDVEANIYAVVSLEDHAWALQWRWQITWDRHKRKAYATRSTRLAGNRRVKLYLHKEILNRSSKVQPCEKHTMGDHGDGDRMDGTWPAPNSPTLDHIEPLTKGGHHVPENTMMICLECNLIKGNRPLSSLLEKIALKYESPAISGRAPGRSVAR